MFQQTAYNKAKMGFYPTDEKTLACIKSALAPQPGSVIFDPCCGEGHALQSLGQHCQGTTLGIELDNERATLAESVCDRVIQADVQACLLPRKIFPCIYLNPPYGDEDSSQQFSRIEKTFIHHTLPSAMLDAIVILVLPHYIIKPTLAEYLCRHLDNIVVGLSPETRFKQAIVIGRKIAPNTARQMVRRVNDLVYAIKQEHSFPSIIKHPFMIPEGGELDVTIPKHTASRADIQALLMHESHKTLWASLPMLFAHTHQQHDVPLLPLSDWHLSLALSSGQISGIVDNGDKRLLVKGSTTKTQVEKVEVTDEHIKRSVLDKFLPVIKALDVKPSSPSFGQILTIH